MSSIGSKDQFVSQITKQLIFQHFLDGNSLQQEASTSLPTNRLVCRGKTDLFFVSNNLVRCCSINPNTNNYKLLRVVSPYYEIVSLAMNKSGTLLAIIGEEEVDVVTLPVNLMKGNSIYVEGSSFKIKNLEGKVKKCVWQTVAGNDSVLVILNDKSQIKAYDLTKSLDIPIIDVDLKHFDNFKNQDATSIVFGSDKNLAGGLTLYVSTESSIYTIYPFTSNTTKLATTGEAIDIALRDTKAAMELIQEKYPSNLTDIASSDLSKAALKQFDYYLHLRNQLNGTLPIIKEVRDVHTNEPYELFVVLQVLTDWEGPILQGPVISVGSEIQDITSIGDNSFVSVIASVGANAVVNYYAQLTPMLMKYKATGDVSDGSKELTPGVQIPKYIKPRKGFGFVDNTENAETALIKQTKTQTAFWKDELMTLDLLHTDKLPDDSDEFNPGNDNLKRFPTYFGDLDETRFTIFMNSKKIVIADCCWVKDFVLDLIEDKVDDITVAPHYGIASTGPEPILAFAHVSDQITSTGEYLLVFRDKKKDDLEVIQIVNNAPEESTTESADVSSIEDKTKNDLALTYTLRSPFGELETELQTMKATNIAAGGILSGSTLNTGSIESLECLNKLSINTIQLASEYSIFGIKLQSRILSNLDSLKEQKSILLKIKSQYEPQNHKNHSNSDSNSNDNDNDNDNDEDVDDNDDSNINEQEDKMNKLISKQEKLDERLVILQKKMFDALNKYNRTRSLPLSEAENSWFKEIDRVDKIVNETGSDETSLTEKIEALSLQVKTVIQNSKEKNNESKSSISPVEQLELEKKLSKVKNWIVREDKAIQAIKEKLTNSLKLVDEQ